MRGPQSGPSRAVGRRGWPQLKPPMPRRTFPPAAAIICWDDRQEASRKQNLPRVSVFSSRSYRRPHLPGGANWTRYHNQGRIPSRGEASKPLENVTGFENSSRRAPSVQRTPSGYLSGARGDSSLGTGSWRQILVLERERGRALTPASAWLLKGRVVEGCNHGSHRSR